MVIDAHCHIVPPSFRERRSDLAAVDATVSALFSTSGSRLATAEELITAMDADGVERAIVMGVGWTDQRVAREANDYIIEATVDYPERLTGFCSVNPGWGEGALKEIERCAAAGLKGIGELHPDSQEIDIANKKSMAPVLDLARSLELPVLVHSSEPVGHQYPGKGRTTPEKLYQLITNYPDNTIICAHWGGGLPFYALMPEVPKSLENVYFDSAASPFLYSPEVFVKVVELIGVEKVLFASDFPLMKPNRALKQLYDLNMAQADKQRILGENIARLLGL